MDVDISVVVEFDPDVVKVDDEWRSYYYDSIRTPEDLALHFAYNYVANGIDDVSRLDGFADRQWGDVTIRRETFEPESVREIGS